MSIWMQARSGVSVDLEDPQPDMIKSTDIAHALGRICRFNGHVLDFYSVAQHCCHVEDLMPRINFRVKALAVLHDAAEAFIGDVSTPVRRCMRRVEDICRFDELEDKLLRVIYAKFHIDPPTEVEQQMIRWADQSMLLTERRDLLEPTSYDWNSFVDPGVEPQKAKIQCWSPYVSSQEYLSRLREIERNYGPA